MEHNLINLSTEIVKEGLCYPEVRQYITLWKGTNVGTHILRTFLLKQLKGALKCTGEHLKQGQFQKAALVLGEHLGDISVYFLSPKNKIIGKWEGTSHIKMNVHANLTLEISGTRREETKKDISRKKPTEVSLALAAKRKRDEKQINDSSDEDVERPGPVMTDEPPSKIGRQREPAFSYMDALVKDMHLSDPSSGEEEEEEEETKQHSTTAKVESDAGESDDDFKKSRDDTSQFITSQVGSIVSNKLVKEKSDAVVNVLNKILKYSEEYSRQIKQKAESLSSAATKRGDILQAMEKEVAQSLKRKTILVKQLQKEEEDIRSAIATVQKLKEDVLDPLSSCNGCPEHCFSSIKDNMKGQKGRPTKIK